MPIYEYKCNSCAKVFETIVTSASTTEEIQCIHCGSTDIIRLPSTVNSIKKAAALPNAVPQACRAKSGFS
ncbi:MAG: zinc ribbon domain-containing protein [Desulfocapsaceae bacterium]|nr:zinc ribbon domain-containing protein [Desulfocapsaceae bacterium]